MPPEINDMNDNFDNQLGNQLKDYLDNDPDFSDDNDDDNHDTDESDDGINDNPDVHDTQIQNDNKNTEKKLTDNTENNDVGVEPPKSWAKEQHDLFKKLPLTAQQQIIKRENDTIQGIKNIYDKLNPHIEFATNIQNILKPYEQAMRHLGDDTGGVNTLASFLEPARILHFGSPQQKAQMLLGVAQEHGVDLIGFLQGIPQEQLQLQLQAQSQVHNPEINALKQQINELTNLEKMRQLEHDKQLESEVVTEITQIQNDKENYPFFDDVMHEMHNLLTSGLVEDLKEAYQKAVLLNPATQEKIIAQQAQKLKSNEQNINQQRVMKARQNALSPKSGSGFGFSNEPLDEDEFDEAMIKKLQQAGY